MTNHPKQPIPLHNLMVGPKIISIFLIFILVIGLLVNLTIGVKKILAPPEINLESPQNGELRQEPLVAVTGRTETNVELLLNGKAITTGQNGNFREILSLQPGLNIIKLQARKRYSRLRNLELKVIYEARRDLTYRTY